MDNYFTIISLLGLRNQNLPPFREARLKRYKSIKKMVELIETAGWTQPKVPFNAFCLSSQDPEWEDDMTYPVIEYNKFGYQAVAFGINLFLYAYNYNVITQNIRFRTFRYLFPVVQCVIFGKIYFEYKSELTKVNLFDEYVQLRAQELVKENEFLLEHEDIKRFVWWYEDYKETLCRVHRQANDHAATDFKDSELILQDFIRRYTNPNSARPLNYQEKGVLF
ncbi:unnamed protein product [Paramecium octaurelia]|uniref:Uncharacterized protein n=1 Tax=Paramecium octaurelia TaxID=43137 RepID=A0A8S1Y4T3_PAROT|nr:unnamed protein product [Paramecium octaurelia]